ncbi:MAG: Hpt domain-containing protein [Flavobacteriales bacterium]|nr:Hpt domain-containing protein [Flavobacteriales bacterium]
MNLDKIDKHLTGDTLSFLEPDLKMELLRTFFEECSEIIDSLAGAIENKDVQKIAEMLHKLGGTSASYGWTNLQMKSAELTQHLKTSDFLHLKTDLEEIVEYARTAIQEISQSN